MRLEQEDFLSFNNNQTLMHQEVLKVNLLQTGRPSKEEVLYLEQEGVKLLHSRSLRTNANSKLLLVKEYH
jgi:hypothetical protein